MPERRASLVAVMCLVAGCTIGTPRASVAPDITPRPPPTPTVRPSLSADAIPTGAPSPTPAPTLDPNSLDFAAVSCNGGVLLDWSASTNPDFHHYSALRSPEREIATEYPPVAPAVDWGDTYTTDRFVTTAVDASILPSDTVWYYRVMAYDVRGRAIAASPVRDARLQEKVDLGSLEVGAGPDGVTRMTWSAYDGEERCFSAYRVLAGPNGATPDTLIVLSDQAASSIETDVLRSGVAYQLRVEAVRSTTLGSFILGETDAVTFTVP
jgi:hypothetical protein